MTTLTPTPTPTPRRSAVSTTVTVIGVVMILLLVASAALQTIRMPRWDELTSSVDVTGVTALDLEISAGELNVEFDDAATEATLYISDSGSGPMRSWDLTVRNGVLRLTDTSGVWFLPSWGWGSGKEPPRLQLNLPSSLEGAVDADLELNGGIMTFTGDLKNTDITVSAGEFRFDGASTDFALEVNAGVATATTSGPNTVDVEVSAGRATTTVTGTAPSRTEVEVNAGRADVYLPEAEYAVGAESNAGQRQINVRTSPSSPNQLFVEVNAGHAEVSYSN